MELKKKGPHYTLFMHIHRRIIFQASFLFALLFKECMHHINFRWIVISLKLWWVLWIIKLLTNQNNSVNNMSRWLPHWKFISSCISQRHGWINGRLRLKKNNAHVNNNTQWSPWNSCSRCNSSYFSRKWHTHTANWWDIYGIKWLSCVYTDKANCK